MKLFIDYFRKWYNSHLIINNKTRECDIITDKHFLICTYQPFMLRSSRDDWIRYLNQIYIVIYNLVLIIQSKFNNFLLNPKEEEVFLTIQINWKIQILLSLPSILSNDISWHAKLLKVLNNLAQFEFTLIIIVPKCKNPILRSYFHSHRRMTVV